MASPFDLVSLADLKSWLGITGTEDDVLLARLITQISRAVFNVIDRPAILPSAYTEIYDGGNDVSIKTHGKAKVARISGMAFANLFYGVTQLPAMMPQLPPIMDEINSFTGWHVSFDSGVAEKTAAVLAAATAVTHVYGLVSAAKMIPVNPLPAPKA